MRILLDESIPRPLKREFIGFDVTHVADLGWQGRTNGYLLTSMREQRLDALITVDRNLQFQQNVSESGIVIVVLRAPTNRLIHLRPLAPALIKLLATAVPGKVYQLGD